MDNTSNNKRIAKNTLVLYLRLLVILAINLYISRVVLKVLGVDDYGIYNVIGGVVTLFTVLSGSLSAAITRYLTYELGVGNLERLKKAFSTSIIIQILLAVVIAIIAEPIGYWFINNKMTIDPERINAAVWVLHFSILTFCVNLINVPFNAVVIAHEKMTAYAYFSILETVLKLFAVLSITLFAFDKLIVYAALLAGVSILMRVLYGIYCNRTFQECKTVWHIDKEFFRGMSSFAGWNFIGAAASVLRDAGSNVVINLFYPPAVNSARGLSMQVNAAVSGFAKNFVMAINPQITKSYAIKDYTNTYKLAITSAKMSYYLMLVLSLPVILNTHYLLSLWLTVVPEYTVIFVQLVLVLALVDVLSETMITVMLATGNIRDYQLVVGGLYLLNLPLSYIALKVSMSPEIVYIIAIAISTLCIFVRLYMLNRIAKFPIKEFLTKVLEKVLLVTLLASVVPVLFSLIKGESIVKLLLSCVICVVSCCITIYFVGLSNTERTWALTILKRKKNG